MEIRKLLLAKDPRTDSSASIEIELRPGREWDVQFVACYRFDDIRSQIGIGDIGLMKIDVEGAELSVLRGDESNAGSGQALDPVRSAPQG